MNDVTARDFQREDGTLPEEKALTPLLLLGLGF